MKLRRINNIVIDEALQNLLYVFKDRAEAGKILAEACKYILNKVDIVYAIPRGGVPVGIEVAKAFNSNFDLLICRKLLIPWNREAGFGAVDPDGNYFVDEQFAALIGLTDKDIKASIEEQLQEIKHRNKVLRRNKPYPPLQGKTVIITDDGIAAGYTMRAAIKFVKSRNAEKIIIATPTGHIKSLENLSRLVNIIICLNPRSRPWFAVADAYKSWRDLTDQDVIKLIKSYQSG